MPRGDELGDEVRAFVASFVEAVPDPTVVLDSGMSVLEFNEAAGRAWPALSRAQPLIFAIRAPDVLDAAERVIRGETRVKASYGERVPVERLYDLTASALGRLEWRRPSAPAVALVFRDLTESRRLDMMRVDFVANASHELRTPLASVLGFIETLQGPARNDLAVHERFLGIMRGQAQRMARLVEDLLSLSRVEMNEHRRPEAPVDLVAVARQICDTLRPLAAERSAVIDIVAAESVVVAGDRDELLRVAENLVENAIKYGENGVRVDVTVDLVEDASDGPQGRLTVRDHGPGIAAEHLPRLTERFYRIGAATGPDKGGTGLGLAIVKHIVNRHRGRLAIESRPGEGATFRVTIPLLPAAKASQP